MFQTGCRLSQLVGHGTIVVLLVSVSFSWLACSLHAQDAVVVEAAADWEMGFGAGGPADPQQQKSRAHLAVHRAFISRVCDLNEEQKKAFASMDDAWLRGLAKKKVPERKAQGGGIIGAIFGARPVQVRVQQSVNLQKQIDEALIAVLTDEQKEAYEIERQKRLEFRNRATANALIEKLNERLDLSDQQRKDMLEALMPWVAQRDLITIHYFSQVNYFPEISPSAIALLNEKQRKTYFSLQRVLFTSDQMHDGNPAILIKE